MAVKARAEITLAGVSDGAKGDTGTSVTATYRYYKLATSAPSKPTTTPSSAPSGWTATEPTYSAGNTGSLYYVDGTLFSNNTFSWSSVQLSSSYAAAKDAYENAKNAETVADGAIRKSDTVSADLEAYKDNVTAKFTENVEYIDGKTEVIKNWIRQGSRGDTPFLELAGTSSSFGARLDNSELGFYDGNDKLAYFGNKKMHIADADIDKATIDDIVMGDYEIQTENGHFSIVYVG